MSEVHVNQDLSHDPEIPRVEEISIHLATIKSLPRVVPLFDEYRRWYGMPGDLRAAQSFLLQRTTNAESAIFFAESGNDVVGFAQLYPLFSSISLTAVWVLNDLFVQAAARGRGVGTALLQTCAEFARGVGATRLELETGSANHKAQQFYLQHGWKPVTGLDRFTLELEETPENSTAVAS